MSKQTIETLRWEPFENFFRAVGIRNNWYWPYPEGRIRLEGGTLHPLENGNMKMEAVKRLGKVPGKLEIVIVLLAHKYLPVLLVNDFVTCGSNYLPGYEAFIHYGKTQAYNPKDIEERNVSKFWTVSSPRDLEALMRVYDNLATIYGKPTVFNLP